MAFDAGSIEGHLDLDRKPFQESLKEALKEARSFEARRFEATLGLADAAARRKLRALEAALKRFGSTDATATANIKTDGERKIPELQAKLKRIPDEDVHVRVHTEQALRSFGALVAKAGSAKVALAASALALLPVMAQASVAVAGIGLAAGGAIAPFGVLGLAMRAAFKEGGPQVDAFKRAIKSLSETFTTSMKPATDAAFGGLTDAVRSLTGVLPQLSDHFGRLGGAVGNMFRELGQGISGSKAVAFFQRMIDLATRLTPTFTRIFGSLGKIFANIATAAAPLVEKVFGKLAGWLEKIGDSTSNIEKLRASLTKGMDALAGLARVGGGVLDIIKAIYRAATDGSDSFLKSIGDAVKKLGEFLNSAKGQDALKTLLENLSVFVKQIGDAMPALIQAFSTLVKIGSALFKIVTDLLKVLNLIPGVGPGIAALAIGFVAWKGPLGAVALALKGIWTLLKNIKGASLVTSLIPGVGKGKGPQSPILPTAGSTAAATAGGAAGGTFLQRFMAKVKALPGQLAGLFRRVSFGRLGVLAGLAGAAIIKAFGKVGPAIMRALGGLPGKMGALFARVGPLIGRALVRLLPRALVAVGATFVTAAGGWVVLLVGALATAIWALLPKKFKDAIWKAIKSTAKAIGEAGVWAAKGIASGVASGAKWVAAAAAKVATVGWQAIKKLAGKFLAVGKDVIAAVAGGIKAAAKAVLSAAKAAGQLGVKAIKGLVGAYAAVGKAVIQAAGKGIKGAASAVASAAKAAGSAGLKAVKGLAEGFFNAGKAIIQKLVAGIKSMAGAVTGAVGDVMSSARGLLPFSEPKDPRSPLARLDRSGQAIIRNIAAGIDREKRTLGNAMRRAMPPIPSPSMAGGGGAGMPSGTGTGGGGTQRIVLESMLPYTPTALAEAHKLITAGGTHRPEVRRQTSREVG